jgi:hypothetical protein
MLRPLLLAVAMVAYGLALGGAGLWMVLYYVALVAVFGYSVVVGLMSLWAQVTGPAPGLTADGVRLRLRLWRRRLVTVPWSEITVIWFGYLGSRRYLRLEADPRGAHADDWDPRGRRYTRYAQPLALFVPATVSEDEVRRAVEALSGGAHTMADRGPEEGPSDGDGPDPRPNPLAATFRERRVPTWRTAPVLLVIALIGVPWFLDVAPPWYQSWWPGVAAVRTLPDACAVIGGEQAAALDVSGRRRTVDKPTHDECEYTVPKGDLTVILERRHAFTKSGSVAAAERLDEIAGQLAGPYSRTDIGDEAVVVANPPGTTTMIDRGVVRLVTRRANVVLVILYGAEKEPGVAQDAVFTAARAALAGLDIR